MINCKEAVYERIKDITDNVTDGFPADDGSDMLPEGWKHLPILIYTEEENKTHESAANRSVRSYIRYRIDIYDKKSVSGVAEAVDAALGLCDTGMGLTRTACFDSNLNDYKHKIMRYEGIIDEKTKRIYAMS